MFTKPPMGDAPKASKKSKRKALKEKLDPRKPLRKTYALLRPTVAAAQTVVSAESYVTAGSMEVRLARGFKEIKAAQRLRYDIFYEEMSARPDWRARMAKRDIDPYDGVCDHLLVIDHDRPKSKRIVGTYRLLRQEVAEAHQGFYSGNEFDLSPLLSAQFRADMAGGKQLLELGRSCVHPEYRANATINMLWKGIAEYLKEHNVGYMFGCASFEGTNPANFKRAFAYLYHNHPMPAEFPVKALADQYVPMNTMSADELDVRLARRDLPPLVKGYLRLGCFIGDGAVVDEQFGTTDVFIMLPVERIASRYSKKMGLDDGANDSGDGENNTAAL